MRIFIAGYFGFGNTGDEIILRATVGDLRQLRPDVGLTVTSATPEQTAADHHVESVLWWKVAALEQAIEDSDLVLIGGGGLFFDTFGCESAHLLTDSHTGIAFYTAPAILGALHHKPVMLYAIGAGPLVSHAGRQLTRLACDLSSAITVRDDASKTTLVSLGVAAAKVAVTADLGFGFIADTVPASGPAAGMRPRIAVSVRPWACSGPIDWEDEIVSALNGFVARHGGSVLLVPFQHLPGQPEDDVAIVEHIRGRLTDPTRAEILSAPADPSSILRAFEESDLVIGMRLHSVVLALLARVPVVALSYDPKVEHVMQRIGLEDHCFNLESLRSADLIDAMEHALEMGSAVRHRIDASVQEMTRLARLNAAWAVALLGSRTALDRQLSDAQLSLLPGSWRAKWQRSSLTHMREAKEING